MARQKIQLPVGCFQRKGAVDSGVLGLHKRNASRLPCLPNKRNRHFIRDVERLDQNRFIALESDGIFYQEFRELIEPDVVHKRL